MSSQVSPAMQPITGASLVQKALNLLMPLVAPHKGIMPVSNGTDIVASPALADGEVWVGDSTKTTGLKTSLLPLANFIKFVSGNSDSGGMVYISYSNPRVAVDPSCIAITLPDGALATSDLEIYVDPAQTSPVTIVPFSGQPSELLVIQPGETVKLSWLSIGPLTAKWIQC